MSTYYTNVGGGEVTSSTDLDLNEDFQRADGGYELTGGFIDRTTGQSGASD
jgi:hypothetical protein